MDSSTHLLAGLSLAGLAMVDPVVAADSKLFGAVLLGTALGMQAPDFDTLLRLKGNACYIRNHRGVSHSWVAIPVWTAVIALLLQALYGFQLPWIHLVGWVLLAVSLHVFSDLFNSYGTMAAWPFSRRFIAWNVIHLFDPFLFAMLLAAICLWALHAADPTWLFPAVFGIIIVYYIGRVRQRHAAERIVRGKDDSPEASGAVGYSLIPTVNWNDWNVIRRNRDGSFTVGDLNGKRLTWIETMRSDEHEAVERSRLDQDISGFLALSEYRCARLFAHDWGWEVRWIDIRYRYREQYPFAGIIVMDLEYEKLGSYIGWLSDKKLMQQRAMIRTY